MNLSSPSTLRKVPPVALLGLILTGCTALIAQAPFSRAPETVEPGSLVGPFEGRVVDGGSGKPLQGAVVFVSWGLETGRSDGLGLVAPGGSVTASAETDSDGRYFIAAMPDTPDDDRRIARMTLIVYKRGYVGWRSDRRLDDGSPRRDFYQAGTVVKLDRATGDLSAVAHLRYLGASGGGNGALKKALAPEVLHAAAEAEAGGKQRLNATLLDASVLLTEDELRDWTGFRGEVVVERLADLPRTASYDSRHFRAANKPESFDVAVRVWKMASPEAAEARYALLEREVPHAEAKDEIADRSLRGYDGDIFGVAAFDRGHAVVVELTCGNDLCRDLDSAVSLCKKIIDRAERLTPEPEAEPEPEKKPEEELKLTPPGQKKKTTR